MKVEDLMTERKLLVNLLEDKLDKYENIRTLAQELGESLIDKHIKLLAKELADALISSGYSRSDINPDMPIYDPNFGDDRECKCGHPFYRHFDGYAGNYPVGCKYCECDRFVEKGKNES